MQVFMLCIPLHRKLESIKSNSDLMNSCFKINNEEIVLSEQLSVLISNVCHGRPVTSKMNEFCPCGKL